ncbi:hypothetical protein CYJ75_12450 [Kocuria rhizophila]|uniref:type II toxin-antitoxin system HicA family toxin n=1 Tax=Kocuria rhizophila TaxID=72000 RepID=UPI000C7DB7D4|nr:type II toxin-antitoxin system HicA family toxin [Kocuria rhizophila]PKZ37078.1 hypothetical protein CYJ75_12450 [Kocuria rhizophila]
MNDLPQQVRQLLHELPGSPPYTYTPPAHAHDHWAVTDTAGHIIACPHTAPPAALAALLTEAVPLLQAAAEALEAPEHHPHPSKPAERRTAAPTVPTPAELPHPPAPTTTGTPGDQETGGARGPGIVASTARWMRAHGVTRQAVAGIVADPQHTRPGYRGATIYAGASLEVVVAEDGATVLAVYPRTPQPAPAGDPPRAPARPARRGRTSRTARPGHTIPSERREFLRLLTDHGFQVTADTSRHRRVTHPDHPGAVVVIPSSPSDHRWALNTASQIRRTFGIDLRHTPRD